jgi:hypothetical protein
MTRLSYEVKPPCSGHRTKSVNESAKIVVYLVVYGQSFMANRRPVFSDSEDTDAALARVARRSQLIAARLAHIHNEARELVRLYAALIS